MSYKIVDQWNLREDLYILYLDKPKTPTLDEDYRNFLIDGKIYKPIPMSHTGGKCIGVQGAGNFVGKEVEFV